MDCCGAALQTGANDTNEGHKRSGPVAGHRRRVEWTNKNGGHLAGSPSPLPGDLQTGHPFEGPGKCFYSELH